VEPGADILTVAASHAWLKAANGNSTITASFSGLTF
jgi:hypothetical protein